MIKYLLIVYIMNVLNLFLYTSVVCLESVKFNPLFNNVTIPNSWEYIRNKTHSTIYTKSKHLSKVTRKQFQVVNMLWKRTKIFVDVKSLDTNLSASRPKVYDRQATARNKASYMMTTNNLFQSRPQKYLPSSPSHIEFYYLDEIGVDANTSQHPKTKNDPKLLKHFNATSVRRPTSFDIPIFTRNAKIDKSYSMERILNNLNQSKVNLGKGIKTDKDYKRPIRNETKIINNPKSKEIEKVTKLKKLRANITATSAYDRVKFFDMYDSDTYTPYLIFTTNIKYNKFGSKVSLEIVNQNMDKQLIPNRTRFVKKHIQNVNSKKSLNESEKKKLVSPSITFPMATVSVTSAYNKLSILSHPVDWSEFPYIAAYIYEPSEVRCDAVAISPHWLVAAAACLSRHHKDPKSDERSAYVSYCSRNWKRPVRISYVQRSIIHPRFHPDDKARKHLYNIGVIQILNSMLSTCSGWSPVPLISHQVHADYDGASGVVVGWGLDRYDADYSYPSLTKDSLAVYQNRIYSKSCPGNSEYGELKEKDVELVNNVYCVLLPPYISEETDSVHGAILLMGGRLVALYLQEERRSSGDQSAQYTGIWRQIRWILDVSREPEDTELFMSDI